MSIGSRIKRKREELGMTQTELAVMVKISKQTLYKYENDIITNIPSDTIERLADKLEVTAPYLMGWEEIKKQQEELADRDFQLLCLDDTSKEYALKLAELSEEDRKDIMKMIDRFLK